MAGDSALPPRAEDEDLEEGRKGHCHQPSASHTATRSTPLGSHTTHQIEQRTRREVEGGEVESGAISSYTAYNEDEWGVQIRRPCGRWCDIGREWLYQGRH